jgi:hypothetical protein
MGRRMLACLFVFLHADIWSLVQGASKPKTLEILSNVETKVHAKKPFDAVASARQIEQAIHEKDLDDQTIMDSLTLRSNSQIQEIRKAYSTLFGLDLCDVFKSLLNGEVELLFVGLCHTPAEFDAIELNNAMEGSGTTETTLIEILTTRTNKEIILIKEAYYRLFKSELEKQIAEETSGDLKTILIALAKPSRDESNKTDSVQAHGDADALLAAGENYRPLGLGNWFPSIGTDEQAFIDRLTTINREQMKLLKAEYLSISGKTLEATIESEFSDYNYEKTALLTILSVSESPSNYFAGLLSSAFPSGCEKLVEDVSDTLKIVRRAVFS